MTELGASSESTKEDVEVVSSVTFGEGVRLKEAEREEAEEEAEAAEEEEGEGAST